MSHVLLLTLVFPPDNVSTAQIMGYLAEDLVRLGHRVTVITTVPHYNKDAAARAAQPLSPIWGGLLYKSKYQGIPVYHTPAPQRIRSFAVRFLGYIGFHLLSLLIGVFARIRPDILIAPSPPLSIGMIAWLLGLLHRVPYIYNVKEMYPDLAVHLELLKNPFAIRLLEWVERFVYRASAAVTVIAPGMQPILLDKGVAAEKITVIPDCVDISPFQPLPRNNDFSREFDLDDKFVVLYAGNMGLAQALDSVLNAALHLTAHQDISILMIGSGIDRQRLEMRVAEEKIANIRFLPYQPYVRMPEIYAASDVCLAPQKIGIGHDGVPSKVFQIMACARPIIASTDTGSDIEMIINAAQSGIAIPAEAGQVLAETILQAYRNPQQWKLYGPSGRQFVTTTYSRELVAEAYHELIVALLQDSMGEQALNA